MAGKKELKDGVSCEWKPDGTGKVRKTGADKIYRHKDSCKWTGTKTERYKKQDGGWSSITRKVLVGNSGESAKFHLRYFEIAPAGYSSRERHRHEHVVICVRGKGRILIGEKAHTIKHLDTVYVSPDTVHQLSNPYDEPFGFFCIVNAKRDKPRLA